MMSNIYIFSFLLWLCHYGWLIFVEEGDQRSVEEGIKEEFSGDGWCRDEMKIEGRMNVELVEWLNLLEEGSISGTG